MTKATTTEEPKGVIVMLSSPDGHTTAAHCFDKGGSSGYNQHKRQLSIARDRLQRAFIDDYCSPIICKAMTDYDRQKIVNNLVTQYAVENACSLCWLQ
jgi:hypothetical protein